MSDTQPAVRVGIYGTGTWASNSHIPNLVKLPNAEIVAVADINPENLRTTAEKFPIGQTYQDPHEMLEKENLDALYSIVPAFARTDVEATAAVQGIHLFSEKPQALEMAVARRIDAAIQQSGVISTVCFRERYRPIFKEARRFLSDKKVVHLRFQSTRGLPGPRPEGPGWSNKMEMGGSSFFDWGPHAVDYSRYISGQNVVTAQAFFNHPDTQQYSQPLSCSFNFSLSNGATLLMTFLACTPAAPSEPYFTAFYEGGYLAIYQYDRIEVNGELHYKAEEFNPWFEQDRVFIEAVQTGNRDLLSNDYHDGLYSLGPVLAGWESAKRGGDPINVETFIQT
jgi:myo-inositol 2-dehydrogenase/D-chiro-inositol 1-dehydrogenase